MQLLALDGPHAVAEPKRLRLHLINVDGRLVHTAQRILGLDATWPWADDVREDYAASTPTHPADPDRLRISHYPVPEPRPTARQPERHHALNSNPLLVNRDTMTAGPHTKITKR